MLLFLLTQLSRRKNPPPSISAASHRLFSTSDTPSNLRSKYPFHPPPSLHQTPTKTRPESKPTKKPKPQYKPPSSLDRSGKNPVRSTLPFDFRFSYTESSQVVRPIGLREPKYSPFGPDRVDRVWTGVCAPVVNPKVRSVDEEKVELNLEEKRRRTRDKIQGVPLSNAERIALVERFQRHKTKRQINIGRDGLTHNMLNDIHNHWKHDEAVRIKCMGVPTVDMKNVCTQLEDKTFGKIIQRHGGLLILYRGRNYHPRKRPVIPLMLWKPQEPIYPRLIKTTIEGLSIDETKEMRKRGLAVPALTRLAKNGYYGSLVPMVRDAFLMEELIRIDCKGLEKSDYKKIGCKLRDLVPCKLVTFEKEQIVIWRGNDYKPNEGGIFLTEREQYDDRTDSESAVKGEQHDSIGGNDNKPYERGIVLTERERESIVNHADSSSSLNGEEHDNTDNHPSQIDLYSGDDSDK
ncbi:CRS2-associated factor 1, mitochondrial isoform X2 [Apium graveolens]|uniref:CRS2-associated factor 1, mitochondrial isoform X2 n=1 Tax=Apium graveolens TaxID=4045 RepID=UPI003D7BC882